MMTTEAHRPLLLAIASLALLSGCVLTSRTSPGADRGAGERRGDSRGAEAGGATCGNGRVEAAEECDGDDLQGKTCTSAGFTRGKLACKGCALDTSGCASGASGQATLVYATSSQLMTRKMDTATGEWSAAQPLTGLTGSPRWVESRASSTDGARSIVAAADAAGVKVQLLGAGPALGYSATLPPDPVEPRTFDIAFERSSGEALLVLSTGVNNPIYTVLGASGWSPMQSVFSTPPNTGGVRWVRLASRPRCDEIALVYSTSTDDDIYFVRWDGSAFEPGSAQNLSLSGEPSSFVGQFFDAAYEEQSGELMIVGGRSCCSCLDYYRYQSKSPQLGFAAGACARWGVVHLAALRGTDAIAAAGDQASAAIWSGAGWYSGFHLWPKDDSSPPVGWSDVAWVGSQPVAVVVHQASSFRDGAAGKLHWLVSSTGGSWSRGASVTVPGLGLLAFVQLAACPAEDRILAAFSDESRSLWVASYDLGKGWILSNGGAPLVDRELAQTAGRPFAIHIVQ